MFVMSYDDFEIYEQMNEKGGLENWILCVYVLVMIFSIATKRKRMFGNIGSRFFVVTGNLQDRDYAKQTMTQYSPENSSHF